MMHFSGGKEDATEAQGVDNQWVGFPDMQAGQC